MISLNALKKLFLKPMNNTQNNCATTTDINRTRLWQNTTYIVILPRQNAIVNSLRIFVCILIIISHNAFIVLILCSTIICKIFILK